jgi:hypothetical protein
VVMSRVNQSVRKEEVSRRSVVCNLQEYSLMNARPIFQKCQLVNYLSQFACIFTHTPEAVP